MSSSEPELREASSTPTHSAEDTASAASTTAELKAGDSSVTVIVNDTKAPLEKGLSEVTLTATTTEETAPAKKKGLFSFGGKKKPTADTASEDDKDVPPKDPEVENYKMSYLQLYRYADSKDRLLMLIGTVCAIANGVSQPIMTILFGTLINSLIFYGLCNEEDLRKGKTYCIYEDSNDKLNRDVRQAVIYLVVIGCVVLTCAYTQMSFWMYTGERQTKRIREEYLKAVLRQDVAWFDKTQTGDITTRLTADVLIIQEGISDKAGAVFQQVAAFLAGFVIAFVKGWRLALVLCAVFPLLAGVGILMATTIKRGQTRGSESYAQAGSIAQEVLSSIRTVVAFGGEDREIERYKKKLEEGEKSGIRSVLVSGVSIGLVMMTIFGCYALGFWYGGTLIGFGPGDMSGGDVLNVFFSIIIGAFSLGQAGPNLQAIGSAIGAARKIFSTLDRVSPIDSFAETGERPAGVEGSVEFRNVKFHYPQRPDVPILKDFSLTVAPGQTVALVGASGSGKSTIVKLLERFYDPVDGNVFVDGRNVRDLNVAWLRDQIGFVGQEPVLFDLTVRQNILLGLPSSEAEKVAKLSKKELDERVQRACVMANAWNFIQALPEGLDTPVGEAGSMMSGGQKQRLAIARAIIREPRILLLDEATSALDTESERIVQNALDKASADRTTIVIAHRLSTIKNADLIVVMDRGEIVEVGKHNELLEKDGSYAALVRVQALRQAEEAEEAVANKADAAAAAAAAEAAGEEISADDLALAKAVEAARLKATAVEIPEEETPAAAAGDIEQGHVPKRRDSHKSATDAAPNPLSLERPRRRMSTASSTKKEEEDAKKKDEAATLKRPFPWGRLYKINSNEWPYFVSGLLASGGNGVLFPMFSFIFAEILTVFGKPDATERNSGIRFWALMFVLLAAGAFVSNFTSISSFGIAGERLTKRIRLMTFTVLMKQDIGFFDMDKHSTGAITARLAEDANQIQGLTGRLMGTIVQTIVTMITGLLIAFINGWALTLVVLAAVPFIGIAGAMQIRAMTGFGAKTKEAYQNASDVANEAIDQIRTVATLGKEKRFLDAYKADIEKPHQFAVRGAFISAIGFAIAQGMIFFAYSLAFYTGSQFVIQGFMTPQNVFKVMFAVIFTAVSAGQASGFAPNYVQAKLAAFSVFDLLDHPTKIDRTSDEGETSGKGPSGTASVKQGVFRYPSRPDVPVLNGLDLSALPGQTVALVGPSGCGKSTVIALVERWYDVLGGSVEVSDRDVREWRVRNLREDMALVGQEPVLFNLSVRDNIRYGHPTGDVTDAQIEEAAKKANIHGFVSELPDGYDTIVGSKGGQLSGGQKQRVAIARALIRDPKLLLLDEATSALDSESERVVQEALDAAAKGRTTLVIAHRLATIQTADRIVVFDKGVVAEEGTYDELIKKGGRFAELAAAQSLAKNKEA
ncbi:ATP-binding cassette, sub-B (MDR TAP), member 4 [Phlyctochytrium bullatum]|nr:ATP-binding cassette, sub-B (MDR TAP), member 4 [Phlyctochytrium bullatum]